MFAYYNEHDAKISAWLRELIRSGLIMDGEVDERDIRDVDPGDLVGFTRCHFFAGIGGWDYALQLAGWPDERPVWTGSPPCQSFSAAGKRKGAADDRNLWPEFARLIAQCRPSTVFGEQVAAAIGYGWLDSVFSDLEACGYACAAAVLPACSVGAPHIRNRLWFVADTLGNASGERLARRKSEYRNDGAQLAAVERTSGDVRIVADVNPWAYEWIPCADGNARPVEPGTFPLAHGIPARVVRLRGYGNAIVPQVAANFIRAFNG